MADDLSSIILSSVSVIEKKDISEKHFRWDSIKKFLFFANAYSHHGYNFDMYSKVTKYQVLVSDFIMWQIILGMPYLFMDGFIKQYTRRIDGFKFLNPLLKGITFGLLFQTAFMTLIQSELLADAIRFFIMTFKNTTPWTECYAEGKNSSCLSLYEVLTNFRNKKLTDMTVTAADYHYKKQFLTPDKSLLTTKCFTIAIVWMVNFFVCTVSDESLVKIYYFLFTFRSVSTIVVLIILVLSVDSEPPIAFKEVLLAKSKDAADITQVFTQQAYAYGVGFLGFYDFGTISPYTMLDTAVVIYSVLFTFFSVVRSWIVKILIIKMTKYVKLKRFGPHYLYFAVLPLSTEFVRAHRLYGVYFYLNFMVTLTGYLTMQTLTMSRLLHSEFRSLKTMYIVGVICCLGFLFSLPFALQSPVSHIIRSLISGVTLSVLYLGAFKVATIMWVYGLEKFSTDIQFWLGFKPTKYWRLCWAVLPIFLVIMMIYRIFIIATNRPKIMKYGSFTWFTATVVLIAIFNIKSISKLLVQGNLASIFTATFRYGPPDPTDRLRRRVYSETIQLRYCKHNCLVIDELIDCNHKPLISSPTGSKAPSEESLTKDIYKADGTGLGHMSIRHPSMYDLEHQHF